MWKAVWLDGFSPNCRLICLSENPNEKTGDDNMALVKGFRGLRFNTEKSGNIADVVCPPYDIISEEQRLAYIEKNEYNIIRLELPKGDNPYENAATILKSWESNGILMREKKDAVYIYEEEFTAYDKKYSVKGCIVRVKVEEFEKGIILPHEFTLSKAKEDRLNLMKAANCNFSQIYALYSDKENKTISRLNKLSAATPDIELTDGDDVTHRMWIVTDEAEVTAICSDFDNRQLFIADGHHRYETALNYRNYCRENGLSKEGDAVDYQMMMLVNMEHPGLVVFPTHRIVRDLSSFNKQTVLNACTEYFDITEYPSIENMESVLTELYALDKKAFGMYCGDSSWTLLVLKSFDIMEKLLPNASKASQGLDVSVLHTLILEKLMDIDAENMAKQINLTYVKQADDALQAVDNGKANCAFILNPTKISEICDVSSAGEKMPQKSTYFYPKLITGLVMNKLD